MIFAVVGFAFSEDRSRVLLIRKKKPIEQFGKLNGVGGKIEMGERSIDAMIREFNEEVGILTRETDWLEFVRLTTLNWQISFFKTILPIQILEKAAENFPTDEPLELWSVSEVPHLSTLRNLKWLVPLALDDSSYELPITVREN